MATALLNTFTRKNRAWEETVLLGRIKHWMSLAMLILVAASALATTPASAEDDGGRKVKSKVSPLYPELARKMNLSGTVKVEVVIGANGQVKSAKVIGGHPVLVEPAVEAVRKWRYEPSSSDSTQTVEFHFNNNQ